MMIIRNSIRQLFRMKGRTALFFLLLAFASGLCSMGRGFWIINREKTAAYEDTFVTIGTVEQKADRVQEELQWDAEIKDYHLYNRSVYDSYVPLSALDFEGADYLSGPEKRCFYGAYMPQYWMYDEMCNLGIVVEGSPVEDSVPDHPIQFKISRVLAGNGIQEGIKIKFCDHNNPAPEMMYADKTYIMSLHDDYGHESEKKNKEDRVWEYVPRKILNSTQVDEQGNPVPEEVSEDYFCDEVTEGFYETPRGRRWLNMLASWDYILHTFPVTGTDDINLLMAFYQGDAHISSGREFTQEEYERGDRVCLVSEHFAHISGLGIGDELPMAFLYANYGRTPGYKFSSFGWRWLSHLNAEGEIYPVFEEGNYRIVGIYGGITGVFIDDYGLGYNEIIIPSRSVKNSDAQNIQEMGPMTGSTTSFRIPNGTIDEYMEKWNSQQIPNVEITFYDRGYSDLEANINNMKYISTLLIAMGAVMVLMVLGYFSWLFILKQGERTATERAMGLPKGKCFLSLFSGIFLIVFLGSICGCTAGSFLSGEIADGVGNRTYYDTTFGNSAPIGKEDTEILPEEAQGQYDPLTSVVQCTLAIVAAGTVIASAGIRSNLSSEPMKMFAEIRRG